MAADEAAPPSLETINHELDKLLKKYNVVAFSTAPPAVEAGPERGPEPAGDVNINQPAADVKQEPEMTALDNARNEEQEMAIASLTAPPLYCHICALHAPAAHARAHRAGAPHVTLLRLAHAGAERVARHVQQHIHELTAIIPLAEPAAGAEEYYCAACNLVVYGNLRAAHDAGIDHRIALEKTRLLERLLDLYVEDGSGPALPSNVGAMHEPDLSAIETAPMKREPMFLLENVGAPATEDVELDAAEDVRLNKTFREANEVRSMETDTTWELEEPAAKIAKPTAPTKQPAAVMENVATSESYTPPFPMTQTGPLPGVSDAMMKSKQKEVSVAYTPEIARADTPKVAKRKTPKIIKLRSPKMQKMQAVTPKKSKQPTPQTGQAATSQVVKAPQIGQAPNSQVVKAPQKGKAASTQALNAPTPQIQAVTAPQVKKVASQVHKVAPQLQKAPVQSNAKPIPRTKLLVTPKKQKPAAPKAQESVHPSGKISKQPRGRHSRAGHCRCFLCGEWMPRDSDVLWAHCSSATHAARVRTLNRHSGTNRSLAYGLPAPYSWQFESWMNYYTHPTYY